MTPRLWALSVAPLLAASSAYAQAPGEVAPGPAQVAPAPPQVAPAAPQAAPAPASPCWHAAAPVPVMEHRWAIGLSIGGMSVAPKDAPDGSEAQFRVGELEVRYRATRRLELQLATSGGRQALADSTDGELAAGTVMLGLRYRFLPEHRWNWFVSGALGGTVIAPHESTKEQRDGATRPLGMLGIGVERRFQQLALQAELRMVGLGQRKDAADAVPVAGGGAAPPPTMLAPLVPASTAAASADQLSGGMFTLGASYYF